jgi:hypothetical protein
LFPHAEFFFFSSTIFFPQLKETKMKFKQIKFKDLVVPALASTSSVVSSIIALIFSMNFLTDVEKIQKLLEKESTENATLMKRIQGLSFRDQRKSIKSISSKLSHILRFKAILQHFQDSADMLVANHANLACSMLEWYLKKDMDSSAVEFWSFLKKMMGDQQELPTGTEQWNQLVTKTSQQLTAEQWNQLVKKASEHLWISFETYPPFTCLYSRRKFCDALCTFETWTNSWILAMELIVGLIRTPAIAQDPLWPPWLRLQPPPLPTGQFFRDETLDGFRSHMEFVACSKTASAQMKSLALQGLQKTGGEVREIEFLARVEEAKKAWQKDFKKLSISAGTPTPSKSDGPTRPDIPFSPMSPSGL